MSEDVMKVLEPFARQLEHWGDSRKSDHHRPPDSALPQISERLWNNMQTWGAPTVAAFSYGDLRAAADFLARLQDEGVPEGEADWSVDDSRLAERIMSYLGVSTRSEGSYEPGASPMRDHVAAMLAARPTPSGDGWNRDVDAAPKDGTLVDLWAVYSNSLGLADGRRYVDSRWHDGGWHDFGGNRLEWTSPPDDENESAERRVTAWRHLPSPPSGDSPEEIARVADEFAKLAEKATPGPWAYEGTSEKSNDYMVGVVCPVDAHGDVGAPISDNVRQHPHYFNQDTSDFGEWYCEQVCSLDETEHGSDGSPGSDAAFIAFCGTHRALILDGLRALTTARSEGRTEATGEIVRLKTTLTEAVASLNAKANRHRDAMKEIAAIPQEDSSERDAAEHDCHQAAADALGAAISVITQAVYPPAEEIAF